MGGVSGLGRVSGVFIGLQGQGFRVLVRGGVEGLGLLGIWGPGWCLKIDH